MFLIRSTSVTLISAVDIVVSLIVAGKILDGLLEMSSVAFLLAAVLEICRRSFSSASS